MKLVTEKKDDVAIPMTELQRWAISLNLPITVTEASPRHIAWDSMTVEDDLIERIDARKRGLLPREPRRASTNGLYVRPAPKVERLHRHPDAAVIIDRIEQEIEENEEKHLAIQLHLGRLETNLELIELHHCLLDHIERDAPKPVEIDDSPVVIDPVVQAQLKEQLKAEHPEAYAALHPETCVGLHPEMGRGNLQHLLYAYEVLRSGSADTDQFDDRWTHEMIDRFSGDHHNTALGL